jgi:hypothetical protein
VFADTHACERTANQRFFTSFPRTAARTSSLSIGMCSIRTSEVAPGLVATAVTRASFTPAEGSSVWRAAAVARSSALVVRPRRRPLVCASLADGLGTALDGAAARTPQVERPAAREYERLLCASEITRRVVFGSGRCESDERHRLRLAHADGVIGTKRDTRRASTR